MTNPGRRREIRWRPVQHKSDPNPGEVIEIPTTLTTTRSKPNVIATRGTTSSNGLGAWRAVTIVAQNSKPKFRALSARHRVTHTRDSLNHRFRPNTRGDRNVTNTRHEPKERKHARGKWAVPKRPVCPFGNTISYILIAFTSFYFMLTIALECETRLIFDMLYFIKN